MTSNVDPEEFHRVALVDVDGANRDACIDLRMSDSQRHFLPDVASSLDIASKYEHARAVAITLDGKVVGFGLYGIDEETESWKIFRLLVDKPFQGQGIGRRALSIMIEVLRERHKAREILIVYHENNEPARRLYASFGFVEYGRKGERILAKLRRTGQQAGKMDCHSAALHGKR